MPLKQKLTILTLVALLILTVAVPTVGAAKRRLPRASAISPTARVAQNPYSVNVAFREDRNAVILTVASLSSLASINYSFSYKTNGTLQGTDGTITDMTTDPIVREFVFGTCSAGVCRYDTGITDAKLTLTFTSTNGLKRIRTYILKK